MELYEEFFKISKAFNKARVKYALIGGIAMGFYSKPRYTKDIDFLILESEQKKADVILNSLGYDETAQPWKFSRTRITLRRYTKIENSNVIPVDILVGTDAIHAQILKNATRLKSHNGMIKIAGKNDLIQLKSFRNSAQDKVDIKKLRQHND